MNKRPFFLLCCAALLLAGLTGCASSSDSSSSGTQAETAAYIRSDAVFYNPLTGFAPEADYPGLRAQARKVTDITRSLSTILDGIPTDCDSCGLREICDEVEGMRELHFQQAGKKPPSE